MTKFDNLPWTANDKPLMGHFEVDDAAGNRVGAAYLNDQGSLGSWRVAKLWAAAPDLDGGVDHCQPLTGAETVWLDKTQLVVSQEADEQLVGDLQRRQATRPASERTDRPAMIPTAPPA